jgi:hypothetical protein
VRPSFRVICSVPILLTACAGQPKVETPAVPAPTVRPLAALEAQQVVVTPTRSLRDADALGWTSQIPRSREYLRELDDEISTELLARGLKSWVFAPALVRAARSNPAYAVDPYALGSQELRNPSVISGARLHEPLASQLRTLIALQESARAVLLPVELRFEKLPSGQGVAVLRIALIDGRLSEIRWIGDVRGDPSNTFSRGLLTSLAAHFADLITAR